jgi:hypothetical protein
MTSPLQKSPLGLLGAFDLKTLGHQPNQFGDVVMPVHGVTDQYLLPQLAIVTASATIAIAGNSAVTSIPVPQGQVWRVLAWSIECTLAAADAALGPRGSIAIGDGTATFCYVFGNVVIDGTTGGGATAQRFGSALLGNPLWLRPGWNIIGGVVTSAAATVAIPCTLRVLFNRIAE